MSSGVRRGPAFSMIAVGVGGRGCGRPNKAGQPASVLCCCGLRSWEPKAYGKSAQPSNVSCGNYPAQDHFYNRLFLSVFDLIVPRYA